jgi:hypothetical protein
VETIDTGNLPWVVAPKRQQLVKDLAAKSRPKTKRRKRISQAKKILARARLYGLEDVRKVGDGGLVKEPTETNGWLVMPPPMYDGIIPHEAWEAAEILTKGLPIKGFLVADDKRIVDRKLRRQAMIDRVKSVDWGKVASDAGRVAATIAVVGAVIAFLPAVLMVGAMVGALTLYDPLLIAVTEDDEWICVYEWWH